MQTPSESKPPGQWAAQTDTPRRSVFGNYRPAESGTSSASAPPDLHREKAADVNAPKSARETAIARSFIYRFLAKAYEDPNREAWEWLCSRDTTESLASAWNFLSSGEPPSLAFQAGGFDDYLNAYLAAFGHAARGNCPLNEIEYGDIKADPLFQPHRLADLAAFYRAFGLELAESAGERHDHLCLELEFMCVLAAKEAYALEHHLPEAQMQVCLEAQKKFLREHLGRWAPAFARRLAAATHEPAWQQLARFTRNFIERECARFGVPAGSQELALRPVDEASDRMCDSCGVSSLPPGALAVT